MYEVLQVVEMAVLIGGSAASELGCGFLNGVSAGMGVAGLLGCFACGFVSLGATLANAYYC